MSDPVLDRPAAHLRQSGPAVSRDPRHEPRADGAVKYAAVWFNVGLRGVVEVALVAALGYAGWQFGSGGVAGGLLAALVPLIGFGIWGAVDFHQLGRMAEPARLVEELVISGLAAGALAVAGRPAWALVFAAATLAHHALTYATGRRLLRRGAAPAGE